MKSNTLLNRIGFELSEDQKGIFIFCTSRANQGAQTTVNIQ